MYLYYLIKYTNVIHILIKIYIILQNSKLINHSFFSYFSLQNIGIYTKSVTNIFIKYYKLNLIKCFDY